MSVSVSSTATLFIHSVAVAASRFGGTIACNHWHILANIFVQYSFACLFDFATTVYCVVSLLLWITAFYAHVRGIRVCASCPHSNSVCSHTLTRSNYIVYIGLVLANLHSRTRILRLSVEPACLLTHANAFVLYVFVLVNSILIRMLIIY